MRKARAVHSEPVPATESTAVTSVLAEILGQVEEEGLFVVDKRGGFGCALMGGHWHTEAVGELTPSRAS